MSRYVIFSNIIGRYFEDDIVVERYNEIHQSNEILRECKSTENIYNIVLMNYYEYEQELYNISLSDEVFNGSYSIFNHYISKIEQRLLNLLASITLYLDFFKYEKHTEKFSPYVKGEFKQVHEFIETENANNKNIKIVKFIRNHIQHNGLVVENFSINGKNLSDKLREQTLSLSINKQNIKANWFNPEDFLELEETLDLKKYIRVYVDFISRVHSEFREITKDKVTKSRTCLESVFQEYNDHKVVYIAEIKNQTKIGELAILLDWDDVRLDMVKRNHVPKAFARHSINTKARGFEDD